MSADIRSLSRGEVGWIPDGCFTHGVSPVASEDRCLAEILLPGFYLNAKQQAEACWGVSHARDMDSRYHKRM